MKKWIAVVLFASFVQSSSLQAAEPSLDELRAEWSAIFPASVKPVAVTAPAPDGYSILRKEFLLIRPQDLGTASLYRSWDAIRDYPAPLRQAHAACVKIITPSWHGAGIVISPHGDILTSYHLVANTPGACVMTLEGRVFTVTNIISFSAVHDLALLHIPADTPVCLPVGEGIEPGPGTALQIVGHPGEISWRLTPGTAIRHHEEGGTRLLHFASEIGQGNSGGPVVDQNGHLCALTACSAQLADGSQVKAGIDITAIRRFLEEPITPVSFADLVAIEKNRRMTDFISTLYVVMEEWMRQWLDAMAAVTVKDGPLSPAQSSRTLRLVNTREATEASVKLMLLRALIGHCSQTEGLDPLLYRSMASMRDSVDQLISGVSTLNSSTSAARLRTTMSTLARHRENAMGSFGKAIDELDKSGASGSMTPPRQKLLRSLRDLYLPPPGCHVSASRHDG